MKMPATSRRVSLRGAGLILIAATTAAIAQAPPAQQPAPQGQAVQGAGAGTVSLGTLEYGPTLYYPQGCQHNGSTVACTFVFVHQAQTQNILAGVGGSQLTGIQFVDDAHVPHPANNAYFVDRYGMRQHVLTVNRGDQGTMMVEFPMVDPRVSSGELHLGAQLLAGIPVSEGGAAAPGAPNALATGNGQQAAPPGTIRTAAAPAAPAGCNTPQMANTAACKLNTKLNNQVNGAQTQVNAAKQLSDSINSLLHPGAAPAQPPPATPH